MTKGIPEIINKYFIINMKLKIYLTTNGLNIFLIQNKIIL